MTLDNVDSVGNFSSFGPVYVADRSRVRAYRDNVDLEGLTRPRRVLGNERGDCRPGRRRIEEKSRQNPMARNKEN
jgi:hypothetical protein